jgi:hypothetical protein
MCLNETCSTVRLGKNLTIFLLSGLMLFNSALEYVIKRVQENREGLKLNATHQLLAYADEVNIDVMGEDLRTIKENSEARLDASKEDDLEVSPEKNKYVLM